jgi:hypothetical protein
MTDQNFSYRVLGIIRYTSSGSAGHQPRLARKRPRHIPLTDRATNAPAQTSVVTKVSGRKPIEHVLRGLRKKISNPRSPNAHCEIVAET